MMIQSIGFFDKRFCGGETVDVDVVSQELAVEPPNITKAYPLRFLDGKNLAGNLNI
jgi:hypothetical protein